MTFRVPKIKSCCCLSLKTGSTIVGCLHLLFVAVILAFGIFSSLEVLQRMLYESPLLSMLVFTSLMLRGIFKRIHHLIFPWIVLHTGFLIFVSLSCFSHAAYLGLMDHMDLEMPFEFVVIVIQSWSILVVYNFYRELKEQQPEPV